MSRPRHKPKRAAARPAKRASKKPSKKRAPGRAPADSFRKLFEASPAKLAIGTSDGTLVEVNRAYADFFGFTREEMVGTSIAALGIISRREMERLLALGRGPGAAMRDVEVLMRSRDGREHHVLMSADIIALDGVPHRFATLVDITELKRAERQRNALQERLGHVQRMEAVGRLAGGIAHDFNNILTAMTGFARFVHDALPDAGESRADMKEILGLADRAARLTNQLLAFSRKQIRVPQVLDLNVLIAATAHMLERLLGETVRLETRLDERPCLVLADQGQLEQVLLNLAINARDAMPDGGELVFETRHAPPGGPWSPRGHDARPVPYVLLSVRDTGCGMTEEVRARAFEPFFTTKGPGKGTGLGLAMVHGIVKQSGGELELESAPGRGATFKLYLPLAGQLDPSASGFAPQADGAPGGRETILLVEDEDSVRRVGERLLTGGGYRVLTAPDGPSALDELERRGRPVDLLVTDVLMPGMSGRVLAREVAQRRLAHRTLFVSGHDEEAIVSQGVLEPGLAFLSKPFTREALLRKLREVLDGPAERAGA